MKVLVTGASGHLATNTIIQLLDNGYAVNAIVRDQKNLLVSQHPNLRVVEGKYSSEILSKAIKGCDFIVHIAAEVSQGKVRYRYYERVNVDITRTISSIALDHKVKRMIYVSTANVFAYGSREEPGDETKSSKAPFTSSKYVKSKQVAQDIVLSCKDKMDVVIVNPSFLIGPYDQKPGSNRLVLMGMRKRILFYPPGGKNFIHVKDAASAIVNSLHLGRSGECYILANENLSYFEFFTLLGKTIHRRLRLIRIPIFVLIILGILGEFLKFLGINNELFMTNMGIVRVDSFYSGKKAQTELKLVFQPVEKAIEESAAWLRKKR